MITSRPAGLGELMLPGAGIGASTGLMAGGLALVAGLPLHLAAVHLIMLGLPMALFGGGYTLLCARGTAKPGAFGPAAVYWLLAFPIARIVHEATVQLYVVGRPGLPEALWAFALYNALLSTGFAFGFIWLHEKLIPLWLMRIRGHNPRAEALLEVYTSYASMIFEHQQQRDALRRARRERRRKQ
ncbi:MAG: hypothetical protein GEV11_20640 [Streptosporangiales bacterium]|nr:hypothetical protein [Streptosporangiales bacterium]